MSEPSQSCGNPRLQSWRQLGGPWGLLCPTYKWGRGDPEKGRAPVLCHSDKRTNELALRGEYLFYEKVPTPIQVIRFVNHSCSPGYYNVVFEKHQKHGRQQVKVSKPFAFRPLWPLKTFPNNLTFPDCFIKALTSKLGSLKPSISALIKRSA